MVVGDCWEWAGARKVGQGGAPGYGVIKRRRKYITAHRCAYELFVGVIPPHMVVRHTCDNPPCCRPEHLRLGTQGENMQDRDARGRAAAGRTPLKLTADKAAEIRAKVASGESQRSVARAFGVSQPMVSGIVRLTAWR